jgi:hypothetical protein
VSKLQNGGLQSEHPGGETANDERGCLLQGLDAATGKIGPGHRGAASGRRRFVEAEGITILREFTCRATKKGYCAAARIGTAVLFRSSKR